MLLMGLALLLGASMAPAADASGAYVCNVRITSPAPIDTNGNGWYDDECTSVVVGTTHACYWNAAYLYSPSFGGTQESTGATVWVCA